MRCVCFDLGGVMVSVRYRWKEVVEHVGVQCEDSDVLSEYAAKFPGLRTYELGLCSRNEYLNSLSEYLKVSLNEALAIHQAILVKPVNGMESVVREVHEEGLYTACLSNVNAIHWDELMDPQAYPAISSLKSHYASFELGACKPDPSIYKAFEEKSGFQGSEILFLDDSHANIQAAKAFGWNTCLIDPFDNVADQARNAVRLRRAVILN